MRRTTPWYRAAPLAGGAGALLLAAARPAPPDPEPLGAGTVSTPDYEGSPALAPDGRTLYFAKRPPVGYFWVICVSRLTGGRWGEPEVAAFSGRHTDTDPAPSPDGRRLLFASDRPHPGRGARTDLDLWVVERRGDGWGEPRPLDASVNSPAQELHPTVDRDGTLYFASDRPGGGGLDVYRAAYADGRYAAPVRLDAAVNSPRPETHPAISPDGRTLVFVSVGRPDEPLRAGMPYARGDLYASVRGAAGWSAPRRLPDAVNSAAAELGPSFTADGTRLLFASERGFAMLPAAGMVTYRELTAGLRSVENGLGNVYAVAVDALGLAP